MYVWSFNNRVKFCTKILMHCCNINKSRRGDFFGSPGILYVYHPKNFLKYSSTNFWVILYADGQTNRQTDKPRQRRTISPGRRNKRSCLFFNFPDTFRQRSCMEILTELSRGGVQHEFAIRLGRSKNWTSIQRPYEDLTWRKYYY